MHSYWWVNQGRTGDVEQRSRFIWAPQKTESGKSMHHWTNVSFVRTGDVILHYNDGFLTHLGVAQTDAYESERPDERGMEQWQKAGWRCDLELIEISPRISREVAVSILRRQPREYSPVNSAGTINQGYLFRLQESDVEAIICQHPKILEWLLARGITLRTRNVENNEGTVSTPLISKPFLILAGISGTGKTRWVREIAKRTGSGNGNLCLIPVRPDWHEPSDLMGYTSRITAPAQFVKTSFLDFLVKAWRDAWSNEPSLQTASATIPKLTPHWLCLDEMNLAPVEQYFADYLSVLESRSWDKGSYECDPLLSFDGRSEEELEAICMALFGATPSDADHALWRAFDNRDSGRKTGIPLPPNLIVVGTVNMDETTHAFSRKVLDRAFTIEFDPDDIVAAYRGETSMDPVLGVHLPEGAGIPASMVLSTTTSAQDLESPVREPVEKLVRDWNVAMDQTPFRVAFRTLNEALLFVHSRVVEAGNDRASDAALRFALDQILMMKLLPRLEGDVEKLGCDEGQKSSTAYDPTFPPGLGNTLLMSVWDLAKEALGAHWDNSKSKRKILYMAKRLSRSGYTSFWP